MTNDIGIQNSIEKQIQNKPLVEKNEINRRIIRIKLYRNNSNNHMDLIVQYN